MNVKLNRSVLSPVIAALAFSWAASANAAPLALNDVTAGAAATQLSNKYGVTVAVPGASARRVSLTLDDADAPGMRLSAISALANMLGLDFTKHYVVSKAVDGHAIPATVDATAPIPFRSTTLPARQAIETVAGVDFASVEIVGDVSGTVTLSSANLTPTQAAQEIAAQTGTTWRLVYTLARRSQDPAHWGRVVGRTANGSAIVEMPGLYFVDFKKQAQQEREAAVAQQKADQEQAAQLQAAQQTAQQQAFQRFLAAMQSGQLGGSSGGYNPNGNNPVIISGGDPSGGAGGYGSGSGN